MSFIPENFNQSEEAAYFKPLKGKQNRVRILSDKPLVGFVQWTEENRPVRWELDQERPEAEYKNDTKPRSFLAVVVWNYEASQVQVWEITQRTIQDTLVQLTKDPDFGHPINYDLKISRKGEGLETTYSMVPISTDLSEDVQDAIENNTVNLRALLTGDNPFG